MTRGSAAIASSVRIDNGAGEAVLDDLDHRAATEGQHRRSAGHGLDHGKPERLRPVDRKQQRLRLAQKLRLLLVVDLADEFDAAGAEQRLDLGAEIDLVGAVDLGRDLERNAQRARNGDGAVGPLLRRDAPEEGQIAAGPRAGPVQGHGNAMMDGAGKIRFRHGSALRAGDRNQRHVVEPHIEGKQIGQVLAAVQRGHRPARERAEQREMELIDMEVQDVEVGGPLPDAVEHQHVIGNRIAHAGVEAQSLRHAGHEFGGRDRIPAGKQRDVMAERHQFLGQVGDDPLGAAVKPWGNAFDQRRDLRDFHYCSSFDKTPEPMPALAGTFHDLDMWLERPARRLC